MSDTKHGWVTPRADGARARCGGPGVCATCDTEAMHEAMLTGCFGVVPKATPSWLDGGADAVEMAREDGLLPEAPASAQDERQAFEEWFTRNDETKDMAERAVRRGPSGAYVPMQTYTAWEVWQAARASAAAPAAGDARDAARYRWLRDPQSDVALVLDKRTGYVPEDERIPGVGGYHTYEYRAGDELDAAIDEAIAASQQQEG